MIFSPMKTVEKGIKESITTTAASAIIIQVLLETIFKIDIPTDRIIEVSTAIGVVTGVVRSVFNWYKHRNDPR